MGTQIFLKMLSSPAISCRMEGTFTKKRGRAGTKSNQIKNTIYKGFSKFIKGKC
jgi:hypothetical protein